MSSYQVTLIRKEEVAVKTYAFHWEKPEGFEYKAGQYVDWTLLNPTDKDEWSAKHSFTIASAPFEKELIFTTRMRDSAFKHDLDALRPGDKISMEGPNGDFVLHEDASIPAVFLTGGIGSTPVRSILLQAGHDQLKHQITVFYSNRTPQDAAFMDLFMSLSKLNPNFLIVPTVTEINKIGPDWKGEIGTINVTMLEKHLEDIKSPIYYLDGPPEMVKGMLQVISDAGIDFDKVRTEDFEGY
jgi:ferredoxin-NADP reductase